MNEINKFENLKKIKNETDSLLNNLKLKLNMLKEIYIEFIENNKSKIFIFGLDSFYFQNRLLDEEYDNLINFYKKILNRMYCEYYKLFKLIVIYIKENISDNKINDFINQNINNIIVYKDLETNKEYDFKQLEIINNEILNILLLLHNKLSEKEKTLVDHQDKQNSGFNINNFVSSFNYDVSSFKNQINLFESYLSFFYKLHFKYLQRIITKVQVFYTQINHDIKFDNSFVEKSNSTNKKDDDYFEFDDHSDVDNILTGEIINTLQRSISKSHKHKKYKKSIGDDKNKNIHTTKKYRQKNIDTNLKIQINKVEHNSDIEIKKNDNYNKILINNKKDNNYNKYKNNDDDNNYKDFYNYDDYTDNSEYEENDEIENNIEDKLENNIEDKQKECKKDEIKNNIEDKQKVFIQDEIENNIEDKQKVFIQDKIENNIEDKQKECKQDKIENNIEDKQKECKQDKLENNIEDNN